MPLTVPEPYAARPSAQSILERIAYVAMCAPDRFPTNALCDRAGLTGLELALIELDDAVEHVFADPACEGTRLAIKREVKVAAQLFERNQIQAALQALERAQAVVVRAN